MANKAESVQLHCDRASEKLVHAAEVLEQVAELRESVARIRVSVIPPQPPSVLIRDANGDLRLKR